MTAVGPAAAAAAYIGQLPAPLRAAAEANTAWSEATTLAQLAIFLIICGVLVWSGLLATLRSQLKERGDRGGEIDVICVAVFGVLALAGGLPLAAADILRAHPRLGLGGSILHALGGDAMILLAIVFVGPLLLPRLRRSPGTWGLGWGAMLGALMFALIWIPYARASGPTALPAAPAGAAREGVLKLIHDTRVPASEVYVSPNPGIDADVTGTDARARVVISKGLWTKASPSELRASIGHLIGHYRHHDQLSLAALLGVLTLATFLGVQLLAPPLARRLGLDGPGDPAALPLLAALLVLLFFTSVVIDHAFIRAINVRADQFSLDRAREPDGLALTLLREWDGQRVDPSPVQEALFYDHPSLKSRLVHAMTWKAAHPS